MHGISHRLKWVDNRANVKLVSSTPDKLLKLCRLTDLFSSHSRGCKKGHREKFAECMQGVVYRIPLTCGWVYIGRTDRCFNDGLAEHKRNVAHPRNCNLSQHCHDCPRSTCRPLFVLCTVEANNKDCYIHEITEAHMIHKKAAGCVSTPPVNLSNK